MGNFSFNNLNLSHVDVQTSLPVLTDGRHVVKVESAKLQETKKRDGQQLIVRFLSRDGSAGINAYLNVDNPSAEAQNIGRSELKSILHFGGHPNPDSPGDITTMKGLVLGIVVKTEEKVINGEKKERKEVKGFFDPSEIDQSIPPRPKVVPAAKPLPAGMAALPVDDEVPF